MAEPPLRLVLAATWGTILRRRKKINKAVGVVVLVRSQRLESHSLTSLPFDHLFSRFPLCGASGLSDFQIDQQPIAVLHQSMRPVTQLSLFAGPLFGQKTLRVGGRLMGFVAALLTVKIHPAVDRDLLGRRLPIDLLPWGENS